MGNRLNIMAVDDEIYIRTLLKRILEKEGYEVTLAEDGSTALANLEKQSPDLILLDIKMPGMNGIETLKLIRQSADMPVIMLTGLCEAEMVREALLSGADDYIRKPFSSQILLARIHAKIRRCKTPGH